MSAFYAFDGVDLNRLPKLNYKDPPPLPSVPTASFRTEPPLGGFCFLGQACSLGSIGNRLARAVRAGEPACTPIRRPCSEIVQLGREPGRPAMVQSYILRRSCHDPTGSR